tara:strand:+ start:101699 stop:104056 length:2358 start_codon:yes stop_codon:yes gene_type:complete
MTYKNTLFVTVLATLFTLMPHFTVTAQSTDSSLVKPKTKPTIGLVLSGGGALGIAHIGVLKVLEERGIKPDFIVGTSMGSVVGGLYALGYTATEIEEIANGMNWESILSSSIPLTYVSFEEKEDYDRYTVMFPFKHGKPTLPTGLIEGQLLLEKLTELGWSGINFRSFDDLPIPFRCLATDVSTGKVVVFDHGSIAMAMRASMSIPTIFAAVNIDSTLMVDGGALNNYPVDVAIKMGADYIIGSDVSSGLKQAYEIDNMVEILYQVAMYPSLLKLKDNIANTDVYIHPNVSEFTAADFTKSAKIITTGEIAANEQLDKLDSLCSNIGYEKQSITNQVTQYPDTIFVTDINYNTEDPLHISQVNEHLDCSAGTDLEIKAYKHDIRLLYGTLKYKSISYWAAPDTTKKNAYTLEINLHRNPSSEFKIGLHYDNVFSVGIATNFTTHDYLVSNSRTKIKFDISRNVKAEFEFLKYFGKKNRLNFVFDYQFYSLRMPIYKSGDLTEFTQSNTQQIVAKFQTSYNLNNKLGIGYYYYQNNNQSVLGNETFKNIKINSAFNILFAEYQLNTLNKNYHPTWGSRISVRSDLVFSTSYKSKFPSGQSTLQFIDGADTISTTQDGLNTILDNKYTPTSIYGNIFASYKQLFRISNKVKFITNLNTALTLTKSSKDYFYRFFHSGGNVHLFYFDYQMYGLNYAESKANNLAIARADFMYTPMSNLFVYVGANYAVFKDAGVGRNTPKTSSFNGDELFGYGINLAYKTPLGPVEVGASLNDQDKSVRWNFQVGFQF